MIVKTPNTRAASRALAAAAFCLVIGLERQG